MCMCPPRVSVGSSQCSASAPAGDRVVLERAAHQPGGRDRAAVVGEGGGAGVGELAHLGQLRPLLADADRGGEADRDLRLVARRARAGRAARRRCRRPGRCSASRGSRSSRRRPPPRCRRRSSPRPRARACAGGRAGRRRPARARGPRRRSRGGRSRRGARRARRSCRRRSRTSSTASTPSVGSSDAGAADDEVVGARCRPTRITRPPTAVATATGPVVEQVVEHRHADRRARRAPGRRPAPRRESATRGSISTPRFIGPGCMTRWPGRRRSGVTHQRARVLAHRRHEVRALLHALALHAQHVDDVGVGDRVDVVASTSPSSAGTSGGGPTSITCAPTSSSAWIERARDARVQDVADDRDVHALEPAERRLGSCRGRAAPGSGAGACRRRR